MATKSFGTATTIERAGDNIVMMRYHSTTVASLVTVGHEQTVMLDNGGYFTDTTKKRMNQFADEFCRSLFSVYQKKGAWFVARPGKDDIPFERGMCFEI